MGLPKINLPLFELKLPSSGETVKFRPFTVKEEKFLLIAQESDDSKARLLAIRQIVNNCCVDLPTDIGKLPSFDLEYCFIKIRSKSVGNELELAYRDKTDNRIYEFVVDLDELEVAFNPEHKNTFPITDTLGVVMGYPTIEQLAEMNLDLDKDPAGILELVKACISSIYDEETVYETKDYSDKELDEFIESLPLDSFDAFTRFFETMPVLRHELHYKDKDGTEKTITLEGIDDFFQ